MLCIVEAVLLLLQWRGLKEYADIMALDYVSNYTLNTFMFTFRTLFFLFVSFSSCYVTQRHEEWEEVGVGEDNNDGGRGPVSNVLRNVFAVEQLFLLLQVAGECGIWSLPHEETALP